MNNADHNASAGDTILVARDVQKKYRMGDSTLHVLKGASIDVRRGEFIAIEGRSGSGKSTLLHLLGALDGTDSGSIQFEGREIAKMSARERSNARNRDFGFIFQFYHLLPELNVLENVLLSAMIDKSIGGYVANRSALRKRAADLLAELGLGQRLKHRPQQLSGGERQRVAIGRALMNNPKVLFADEPTGNLDVETGLQIMAILERLHSEQKQTIVMVTHDRSLAGKADRVLVLTDGRMKAGGQAV